MKKNQFIISNSKIINLVERKFYNESSIKRKDLYKYHCSEIVIISKSKHFPNNPEYNLRKVIHTFKNRINSKTKFTAFETADEIKDLYTFQNYKIE